MTLFASRYDLTVDALYDTTRSGHIPFRPTLCLGNHAFISETVLLIWQAFGSRQKGISKGVDASSPSAAAGSIAGKGSLEGGGQSEFLGARRRESELAGGHDAVRPVSGAGRLGGPRPTSGSRTVARNVAVITCQPPTPPPPGRRKVTGYAHLALKHAAGQLWANVPRSIVCSSNRLCCSAHAVGDVCRQRVFAAGSCGWGAGRRWAIC